MAWGEKGSGDIVCTEHIIGVEYLYREGLLAWCFVCVREMKVSVKNLNFSPHDFLWVVL